MYFPLVFGMLARSVGLQMAKKPTNATPDWDKVHKFGIGGSCKSNRDVEYQTVTFMNGICRQKGAAYGHSLVKKLPEKYTCKSNGMYHQDVWFKCK